MIDVSGLSKSFGSVQALDGVSFEVEEGEIVGFLGPNGAGKSTTMRILTGFLCGDRGTVRVAGFDVRTHSLDVRKATGYLPEAVPLYPEMRVREYLRFRARLKGIPRSRRRASIEHALEQTAIRDVERRIIGTLSRGYRQRVGLADALLGEPAVLILDEPTVGLDPEQVRLFRQMLKEVGRKRTVVLSTHILSEVELVCSKVVIINEGRVVARDTADGLRTKLGASERTVAEIAAPAKELRATLLREPRITRVTVEAGNKFHRVLVESGSGEDLRTLVYQVISEHAWSLRELHREERSLEDVFVDIVEADDLA